VSARPRLLYFVHQFDYPAGVSLHVRSLARGLRNDFEIAVAFPDNANKKIWVQTAEQRYALPGEEVGCPLAAYNAPVIEKTIAQIVRAYRPELIHVQHWIWWPLCLMDMAAASGARTIASFHDYYAISPNWEMGDAADPMQTLTREFSLRNFGGDYTQYLQLRRDWMAKSLAAMQARVVPSDYLRRQMRVMFPLEYEVIEYGVGEFAPMAKTKSDGLRFGFIGTLGEQKGWRLLVEAFSKIRQKHPSASLKIHGAGQDVGSLPDGVSYHGGYRWEDLPRILAEIDVVVLPSTFSETYCMALSDAWMSETPAAVSDIGALADRVQDGINGRKFAAGNVDAIVDVLNWFLEDQSWRGWKIPRPNTERQMWTEYAALYRRLLG
jgi:glycosyltransferase involved in cell wall biosynthesis